MISFFEQLFAWLWNLVVARPAHPTNPHSLSLGSVVIDEQPTATRMIIPQIKRAEHMAILGKTGIGKSSLLLFMASQDIVESRGFVFFDVHGDATPALLGMLAERERALARTSAAKSSSSSPATPSSPSASMSWNRRRAAHALSRSPSLRRLLKAALAPGFLWGTHRRAAPQQSAAAFRKPPDALGTGPPADR